MRLIGAGHGEDLTGDILMLDRRDFLAGEIVFDTDELRLSKTSHELSPAKELAFDYSTSWHVRGPGDTLGFAAKPITTL